MNFDEAYSEGYRVAVKHSPKWIVDYSQGVYYEYFHSFSDSTDYLIREESRLDSLYYTEQFRLPAPLREEKEMPIVEAHAPARKLDCCECHLLGETCGFCNEIYRRENDYSIRKN